MPSQDGPLRLPLNPPNPEAARAARKLRGHTSAATWLPEGLWPELDKVRSEQLRVRHQASEELAALEDTRLRFRAEDEQHTQELRQAQRDGAPSSIEDGRTPGDERRAQLAAIVERLWAAVVVLAEIAESVMVLIRQREDDWLADLRAQLEPAREKRRAAQRLLDEARAEEWRLHQLGQWVQVTADDGPFGRQPVPTPDAPPQQFAAEVAESMLERPWHKRREPDAPPTAWQELQPAQGEHPEADATGVVSELVEIEAMA